MFPEDSHMQYTVLGSDFLHLTADEIRQRVKEDFRKQELKWRTMRKKKKCPLV